MDWFVQRTLETNQPALGKTPYQDYDLYVKNSPLRYADKINTPLLLLSGDLDYAGQPQAEALYVSLHRQGKKARLVRFWGEGHVFQNPANVVRMWDEALSWLDRYLPVSQARE